MDEIKAAETRNYGVTNVSFTINKEAIMKGRHGFMCQYEKGLNFETIWSSVFNLDTLDIYRAEGDPRRKKYILDERLKR